MAQDDMSDSADETKPQVNPKVLIDTSMGAIILELYPDKAPNTVAHFLKQVSEKRYDGIVFHRVMEDFVIQAGSWNQEYEHQEIDETVDNEANNGLSNTEGTIAMAQSPGDPNSATLDFYINLKDNTFLDYREADSLNPERSGYTVFGRVTRGMNVVKKIEKVETYSRELDEVSYSLDDSPVENVVIIKAREVNSGE